MPVSKPWRALDGEGRNGNYVLLQDSDGNQIKGVSLTIRQVLEFLFTPDRTCVWYAGGYDWNMLFRDSPKEEQILLFKDKEHKIMIDDYEIELFPKKILRIKDTVSHETSVHYDVLGFFQCSFVKALEQWKLPIPDIITRGKLERDNFGSWTDSEVEKYNLAECKLLVQMMEKFQLALDKVGYGNLSGYHGAGAIAAKMLDNFKALSFMEKPATNTFRLKILAAYYGGRIELFKRAEYAPVYNYDINSAYPAATRELPNLVGGKWNSVKGDDALKYDFGIVDVSWTRRNCDIMGPFPYRGNNTSGLGNGAIAFPITFATSGSGTYHLVEIKAAVKKDLWNIKIGRGLALENGYQKPFETHINLIMKERLRLKHEKDFAHIPLKLGANSFYGKFAQRNKDKREYGHYANYTYAGFITAWTRAELMTYSKPDALILLATDGIYSTEPLNCPLGPNLGQWEYEPYSAGRFILPGIYALTDETHSWKNPIVKTRGYPKMDFDYVYSACVRGKKPKISDKLFVGIKRSLQLYKKYPKCGFYTIEKTVDWNGTKKRHFILNDYSVPPSNVIQPMSEPFKPWLDGKDEQMQLDSEAWSDTYES